MYIILIRCFNYEFREKQKTLPIRDVMPGMFSLFLAHDLVMSEILSGFQIIFPGQHIQHTQLLDPKSHQLLIDQEIYLEMILKMG